MLPHLFSLTPDQLAEHLRAVGTPCSDAEARRVLSRLVGDGRPDLSGPRPVSKALRAAVDQHTRRDLPRVLERVTDPDDGSVRYLFEADDGVIFEAVRIPLHKAGRFSVCLSSQAGCAMACDFCATGRLGLKRNLKSWEMVAQWRIVQDEAPGRVSGAVFMGQGEPLHNYEEVIQAATLLSHPNGGHISADNITISTVGLVPQLRRYTREGHPFRLIVSLTSAIPERRAQLLPVAGRFPLSELMAALKEHADAHGDRQTVAWVLMSGVNTGEDEVEALKGLLEGMPLRFNLIDVNDSRPDGYARADDAERKRFIDALQALKAPVVRRYSVGRGRHSACGMLAGRRLAELAAEDAALARLSAPPPSSA
ncbi:radical SAM protein [Myxococcota bacterium]|nr:radical SAM protein [Myxococcota bacterium]